MGKMELKHIQDSYNAYTREQLEEMYQYKPVPVDWFIQSMWQRIKENVQPVNGGEVLEQCYLDDAYDNYTDIFRVSKEAHKGNVWVCKRIEFLENVCKADETIENNNITFCADLNDINKLNLLQLELFVEHYELAAFFVMMQMQKIMGSEPHSSIWFKDVANYGYLRERIIDDKSEFILIKNQADQYVCEIIMKLLQVWGHSAFIIDCGGNIYLEEGESVNDTVAISFAEAQCDERLCNISYYNIYYGEEYYGTNLEYILENLVKTRLKRELAIVLAVNDIFDYLGTSFYGNHVQMMSDPGLHYFKNYLKFGWVGDYIEYMSDVFTYDVRKDLTIQAEYDFSIIIPVKNSVETFKYTLETCINQDYKGNYEIVISDNSDYGRMEIFCYIRQLAHPNIHYYKTPRNLPLTKSFEFAILKSRGKYIIPLGADDGLLPWCLSTLKCIWEQYPKEDIVQWERQFYAWPGFNGNQQNQLVIRRNYVKDQFNVYYKTKQDYLALALLNDNNIYSLPLLYINSAFKREYMTKIYEATGRLWDGASQDVYMGIISVGLHDKILNMKYPLSIAGMSNSSVGARQKQLNAQDREAVEKWEVETSRGDNVAVYIPGVYERILPILPNDVSLLYLALMRAIERGVFPKTYINDLFDMRDIFKKMYGKVYFDDPRCGMYLHMGRYKAKRISEPLGQWYEENIYAILKKQRKITTSVNTNIQGYEEGENTDGGWTVDASKYGVFNVFQASEFIARFVSGQDKDLEFIKWRE